jgi:hypothetical protein
MTAPRIESAHGLVAEIREALDASDLQAVGATLDATEVESGARHGVVVVAAPKLTFAGPFEMVSAAFELHVVAGPADDWLGAWERIDTIVQALVDGHVNLADGEPSAFQPMHGDALPAYTLTLNDLD